MYILSPAKINLTLAIHPPRPDGFHAITSLVTPIAFFDRITLHPNDQDAIECSDPACPSDDSNLALKALQTFRKAYPDCQHFHIHLHKNIPSQAGLGGGSGNATSVLKALNSHYKNPLTPKELHSLAASLGSDCPLFLNDSLSLMTGRGEHILPVRHQYHQALQRYSLLLFKPDSAIPTAKAFESLRANPDRYTSPEQGIQVAHKFLQSLENLCPDALYNTFEQLLPDDTQTCLKTLREKFNIPALLSGSGSACVCLLSQNSPEPEAVIELIHTHLGKQTWVHYLHAPWLNT